MPVPVGKKSDKGSKGKQRCTEDGQQEENTVKHTAPEGYDENEDLLTMEIPPPPEHVMDSEGSVGERLMISHIVVENFKSYYGTQTIGPFHKNFTAVIGPNGSGKSNVIDALLFVFGYRASKIRSKKLSVLIHSSAGRDDIPSCTVAVNFQRIVDISRNEWRVTPGSQFFVSRTAFRDNTSRYTLNGKTATFKEISVTLRRCGIDLLHNRFLILQGELLYKLDGIQEQRAAQLLRLKYAEKERLTLVEPVKEILAVLRLETAFSLVENKIFSCKRLRITDTLVEAAEGHEKCLQEVSSTQSLLQVQSEQNKKLKSEKKELEKVLERYQQDLSEVQTELGTQNQNVSKGKNDIERLKKREMKLQEDIVKKEKQIADLKSLPEKAEANIEAFKETLREAEEQISQNRSYIEQKLGEVEEKTSSLKVQRKKLDVELATHSVTEDAVQSKLSLAQEELNFLQADEDTQKKVLVELNNKLTDLRQNLVIRTREYNETQGILSGLSAEKIRLEEECVSLRKKESALMDQIREAQSEIEESRQSAEQFRSSNRLLQALMQQKQQAYRDYLILFLGDLGAIDSKYDVAISTTCGALDNIVVDSVNTAQKCIEFLKRERLGIASFIALDKQQKLITHMRNKPKTPEDAPRLFDLIRVADEEVLPAFYYALTDTLIAEDISIAARVSMPTYSGGKRWRTVTLKGEVVEVSGAMTGGGNAQRIGKIGSTVKVDTSKSTSDNAKDLSKLNQRLKEIEAELVEVRQKLAKSDGDYRNKNEELNRIYKLATDSEADKNNLEQSILLIADQVASQLRELKRESEEICKVTCKLRSEFRFLTEEIDNIEKKIVGPQKEELHRAESRKKNAEKSIAVEKSSIASNKRNLSKAEKCMADLQVDLERASENIQSEESKIADSEALIVELQSLVTQHSEKIRHAEEALKNSMESAKSLNAEELELQARLKVLNEKCQALGSKMKDLECKIAVIEKNVTKLPFFSLQDLDSMPEEVKSTNNDKLLNKIFSEELPTDSIERENLERSAEPSNVQAGTNGDEKRLASKAVCVQPETSAVGVGKLPRYKDEVIRQFNNELLEKLLNRLDEIRSRSANKDACSMGVLNDYNDRVKSYNAESEVFQRISKQRDLHREFCQKLRNLRLSEFMTGFHKIGLALKDMYQMITMGISFGVRPPKKSWKQIVNLSGGEKTLASLAFVFGLHSYRPTPLYVMDEIDAALDFRNVSIISSYILEKTKNAQFVVISLRNNMFERGDRIVGIYKIHDCTQNAVLDPKAAERERKKNVRALKEFSKKRVSGQSHEDRTLIAEISMNEDVDLDGITNEDVLKKLSLSQWMKHPELV
uniref:Structural maintenance of chromosomes protein n=1 Tax=Ditylenchus dipsaci TaxID=166011 RepID=A0A915DL97_9BILA